MSDSIYIYGQLPSPVRQQELLPKIAETPELVKYAPKSAPIGRLDDVKAVKEPRLRYGGVCG